jgi:hypothetical protein
MREAAAFIEADAACMSSLGAAVNWPINMAVPKTGAR